MKCDRCAGIAFFTRTPDGPLILLVKRSAASSSPGQWSIPGGHPEPGERLRQTAYREAVEEVGPLPPHQLLGFWIDPESGYTTWMAAALDAPAQR
jgi:8-oxo-dGTP pyrophosphatase MutT (NUDIX family)